MAILLVLFLQLCALAFTPWFVELLWNWLMPVIFQLPQIDYWQAFGLVMLIAIIRGGLVKAITINQTLTKKD